jgi:hypothetical protein
LGVYDVTNRFLFLNPKADSYIVSVLMLWVRPNTVDRAVFCFSAEIPKVQAGKRKIGDILPIN